MMGLFKRIIVQGRTPGSGLSLYFLDDIQPSSPVALDRQPGEMAVDGAGVIPGTISLSPVAFKTTDDHSVNIQPADFMASLPG
jgi:hypothetical protein